MPWFHATTGQPFLSARPSGTNTIPVTATGPPSSPVDRYITRYAAEAWVSVGRKYETDSASCLMSAPGLSFARFAGTES